MDNLGLNSDVSVGDRKFHVQTDYSSGRQVIIANVFNEGEIVGSKEVALNDGTQKEEVEARINELHQEMITEMEVLYYIYEKVKTVRHATSANKLGMLFLQKNLTGEAIEQFELALEIDADFAEVYANYGKALLFQESYERAIEILEQGAEKAPNFADIQNYLGLSYLHNRDFEAAVSHLQRALELNPDYLGAHYHIGIARLGQSLDLNSSENGSAVETRKLALQHLDKAAERIEDRDLPNFEKIKEMVSEGSYGEAVDEFLQHKPKTMLTQSMNVENEFYLKFMYGGKGKDDSFISDYVEELNELIGENPDYADVHNNLGVAHLIQCRNLFLKALDEFRTALKINPNFKKAEKNLKLAENDGKGFLILLRAILK